MIPIITKHTVKYTFPLFAASLAGVWGIAALLGASTGDVDEWIRVQKELTAMEVEIIADFGDTPVSAIAVPLGQLALDVMWHGIAWGSEHPDAPSLFFEVGIPSIVIGLAALSLYFVLVDFGILRPLRERWSV